MPTNIKDVAKLAGVSVSTVSNVRTGKKKVSPESEKKVREAIKTLNYTPNPMASGLRSSSSKLIGVMLPSLGSVFFGQILRGIQDASDASGYIISVYETNNSIEKEMEYLDLLSRNMAAGVILASQHGPNPANDPFYKEAFGVLHARKNDAFIVSIDERLDFPEVDSVIVDNRAASRQAVQHLISLGHRKIGHINGPLDFYNSSRRLEGYYDALKEVGITPHKKWLRFGEFSPLSGYNCMRDLLKETDVTAVFAANDQIGIGAIKAIHDVGLRVPEDIAVIGFDNIFAGTLISPNLSTVHVPTYQMGTAAMHRILQRISGEVTGPKEPFALKTNIIIRRSTDASVVDSWDLHGW